MPTAMPPTTTSPGPGDGGSGTSTTSIDPTARVTAARTTRSEQIARTARKSIGAGVVDGVCRPEARGQRGRVQAGLAGSGVLIVSAGIGEGHDLPARWLASGLAEEAPGVPAVIEDGLLAMGRLVERV